MGVEVDRAGVFRGQIVEYWIVTAKESQSVAVGVQASLTEYWDEGQKGWVDWSPYDVFASGRIWVIKKDGTPNQRAVENLVQIASWDGSFTSIHSKTWEPMRCVFVIKAKEYQGQTTYEIDQLRDHDADPEKVGTFTLDDETIRKLQAQHGSALRAVASSVKRNGQAAPAGKPAAPRPAAKSSPKPPTIPQVDPANQSHDPIPF